MVRNDARGGMKNVAKRFSGKTFLIKHKSIFSPARPKIPCRAKYSSRNHGSEEYLSGWRFGIVWKEKPPFKHLHQRVCAPVVVCHLHSVAVGYKMKWTEHKWSIQCMQTFVKLAHREFVYSLPMPFSVYWLVYFPNLSFDWSWCRFAAIIGLPVNWTFVYLMNCFVPAKTATQTQKNSIKNDWISKTTFRSQFQPTGSKFSIRYYTKTTRN